MNPSVTIRNFVGGLFGGLAGVLVAYYFNPALLLLGVLVGVIVGWWYVEAFQIFREAYRRAKDTTGGLMQKLGVVVMYMGSAFGLPLWFVRFLHWTIAHSIVGSTVWIATVPGRTYRWSRAHPMNIATALRDAFNILWMFSGAPLGYIFGNAFLHFQDGSQGFLFGLLGFVATMFGAVFGASHYGDTKQGKLCQYYRDWEIISNYGYVGFVAYLFAVYARYTVGFAIFTTIVLGWGFPLAVTMFLGIFPAVVLLDIIKGFGLLVQRAGHWLCFGVTLTVTGLSWLYFQDEFVNEAIVWSVALITGVASGAMTELIRRPLFTFYGDTAFGRWAMLPMGDRIMGNTYGCEYELEQQDGYVGIGTWLAAFWLGQSKVARLLRAICLGYPVARPVAI